MKPSIANMVLEMITKKGIIASSILIGISIALMLINLSLAWLWITVMIFGTIGILFTDHVASMSYPTTAILLFEDDLPDEDECDGDFCPTE